MIATRPRQQRVTPERYGGVTRNGALRNALRFSPLQSRHLKQMGKQNRSKCFSKTGENRQICPPHRQFHVPMNARKNRPKFFARNSRIKNGRKSLRRTIFTVAFFSSSVCVCFTALSRLGFASLGQLTLAGWWFLSVFSPYLKRPDPEFRARSGHSSPCVGELVLILETRVHKTYPDRQNPITGKAGDIVRPLPAALRRGHRIADPSALRCCRWLVRFALPRLRTRGRHRMLAFICR